MQKRKFRTTIVLMVSSMTLLLLLQGLWLRSEYKGASDSFRREANFVFRSTMHHLADSLFFSQMNLEGGIDSLPWGGLHLRRHFNKAECDTTAENHRIALTGRENNQRHLKEKNPDSLSSNNNGRLIFNMFSNPVSFDTLELILQKAYLSGFQGVKVSLLAKEANWFQAGWNRPPQERNDSITNTTFFMPLGMEKLYAARFSGVQLFLLKGMVPQMGFSLFITCLILFSFILVYRNLLTQQQLIEQRNDFIGNMTHELKTPVATVGVALEAMKNFDVLKDPQKANRYLEMAIHELDRLTMITDKILMTSVFDFDTDIRNNSKPVDLKPIIERIVSSFKLIAEKTSTRLDFSCIGSNVVVGHEEHLSQVIYNILDNAFKYAFMGEAINLSLEEMRSYIRIRVTDQGPGIAEEHQQKIFEKFYRVPSGNVHNVKGYGLGLNYVLGVINSHDGKIIVQSNPGEGATFEIRIPKTT
jgi:two-component system, OmpR family, phosphate regulon sensor histidine kinase PhoR